MSNDETHSTSAKPSIIDLEAEDVIEDKAENESVPPPPPPKPAPRQRRWLWGVAALGLGAVAGGWFYKDVLAGYFPSDAMKQANGRIELLEAQTKTLNDQLTALANQSEQLKGNITTAQADVEQATAAARDSAGKSDAVEGRLASVESLALSLKTDVEKLAAAPVPAQGTAAPVDQTALQALAQRLDAVEKDIASLKAQRAPDGAGDTTAALSQALSDIKAKIAAGTAFPAEYDRLARMVPAASGLDVLKSRAAEGLPNAQGLAEELRKQIALLPPPEAAPSESESGYLASVWDALSSVVTIRNVGSADFPAVASKAAALADTGDLQGAIAVIDGAEGEKPVILSQWRDRAEGRIALEAALEQASAAVLRQISSASTTQ